jgi:hypothetical protein
MIAIFVIATAACELLGLRKLAAACEFQFDAITFVSILGVIVDLCFIGLLMWLAVRPPDQYMPNTTGWSLRSRNVEGRAMRDSRAGLARHGGQAQLEFLALEHGGLLNHGFGETIRRSRRGYNRESD